MIKSLDSIINLTHSSPFELIVVDDGSNDESLSIVTNWKLSMVFPQLLASFHIITTENNGEAHAINLGIRKACGKYIAWVESDVFLDKQWLSILKQDIETFDAAGVGGLLLPASSDNGLAKVFGYEIAVKIWMNTNSPTHITSANVLYRTDILRQIGPCRTDLGVSSFDSDINHRIIQAGFRLHCNREAIAWHHYKNSMISCMNRFWWYGYKRIEVPNQVLYSFDFLTGSVVLVSGFFIPLIILSFSNSSVFLWGVLLILLLNFIYTVIIFSFFRYPLLLVSFPMLLLRNHIFLCGYICGAVRRFLTKGLRE